MTTKKTIYDACEKWIRDNKDSKKDLLITYDSVIDLYCVLKPFCEKNLIDADSLKEQAKKCKTVESIIDLIDKQPTF